MTIRCTPLPHRSDVSWCRWPYAQFTGDEPCRACAREMVWPGRHTAPTRDITKPVRWMRVEDLHSQAGVRIKRQVVVR